MFQPSRDDHKEFMIYDIPYNQKKLLETIYEMQENKTLAVTYNLCPDGRLAIQYDVEKLCDNIIKLMNNRVFAVDLNPNYIGWVVIEWNSFNNYRIIDYGVESFKELNDSEDVLKEKLGKASTGRFHYTEKKEYETEFIAKKLINRAKHYLCSVVGLDGVNISSSNKNKGRFFNRLVNNKWLRTEFQNTYMKNAILCGMKVIDVPTPYTSVIGNFLYRHTGMPDMCLAAMEISRRAYRANRMNLSNFEMKKDMHIFPDKNDFKEFFDKSCDEFKLDEKDRELTFKEINKKYLKDKKYRVKLEDTTQNMKIIKHRKRYTAAYCSR